MSFFVKAATQALTTQPVVISRIDEAETVREILESAAFEDDLYPDAAT